MLMPVSEEPKEPDPKLPSSSMFGSRAGCEEALLLSEEISGYCTVFWVFPLVALTTDNGGQEHDDSSVEREV